MACVVGVANVKQSTKTPRTTEVVNGDKRCPPIRPDSVIERRLCYLPTIYLSTLFYYAMVLCH